MVNWALRPAVASDVEWMAELRAVVMRPDLERLGRYDPVRVRSRFTDAYVPDNTVVITVDHANVGLVAVRREADAVWIEHFYIAPNLQGLGIGHQILTRLLDENAGDRPFRLNVLQGSAARRLYERHGFVLDSEDEVDVFMRRDPSA